MLPCNSRGSGKKPSDLAVTTHLLPWANPPPLQNRGEPKGVFQDSEGHGKPLEEGGKGRVWGGVGWPRWKKEVGVPGRVNQGLAPGVEPGGIP